MKEFDHEFAEHIYYTASPFEKKGGLWPVRAGWNRAKAAYIVGPKIIECYSVHFIIEGSLYLEYPGGSVTLHAGDVFCLYPNQRYLYRRGEPLDEPVRLRMYWLAFNGTQAPDLLDRLGISLDLPYSRQRLTPDTEASIQQTLSFMRGENADDDFQLSASIYRLFGILHTTRDPEPVNKSTDKWINATLDYIRTHYMEGIAVADIVRASGVHRSHLYSEMTRLTGMGPQQYLTKLRMERAVAMLRSEAYSITEIALSLGYPDLYSFSRAFGKQYGMPPSRYLQDQTK
ncbi:AraC-like DNA-binding protein [Paenibacillus cellulosilyticus]|uniref:AraC-like DNA-binding protein n=1 Tax=Paenibacillus cellulosilyticus TaxID=375489 RepID=A0A2V2YXP3_9BACL|nr:AraC family transcriptional regulator [Paenibacillus cellulosilyticus]PWW05070.1 AraC-like DNA-binding protein [Paenibacillus cellulosilyticus]QKS48624.1 helix-turn-helix transcriptional regulator [Paenibacillus cellulosilyticus]